MSQVVARAGRGVGAVHLHLADRTDRLADELAALLAQPVGDALASELVVVPAKGVERWLTQRLSHRLGVGARGTDGVCAGVDFRSPRSLVATLTGTDRSDPWDPDRLVWPVLAAIDASLEQPWCAMLARHLGEGHQGVERELRRGRRWSVARRIAGLFASYAVQRPALLEAWSAGGEGAPPGPDSVARVGLLPADLDWQSRLWREVVALVDAPPPHQRHRDTLAAIRAGKALALPDRLSLFGHTRLPVTEIELLRALAEVREVHLWLPLPSLRSWRRLARTMPVGPVLRSSDDSASVIAHPLLSSLGRDTRELQRSLVGLGSVEAELADPTPSPATLLGWLQSDLRDDREPDPATVAARVVSASDRSVQVHATHGPARQVEVLREVLVGLLEDDPTLEPRDIVVMCPDVEVFSARFQAAFGLRDVVRRSHGHPAHELRLQLADRGLARTNPLLALATQVVDIAAGRATLTQVLDLASSPPVRHRFGLGDDELSTVTRWASQAGVRWGLTAGLRDTFQLSSYPQNTWSAGLDRLLVGVAMAEGDSLVGDVLPLDDVPSADVELSGRLAELVDRLEALVDGLRQATGLREWLAVLRDGVLALGSTPPREAWQVTQFERELSSVEAAASGPGESDAVRLRLPDLRALLEQRSGARPTRANFRTGSLTVCTMVPMRSVPHRVVCLVGLDDGVFPRAGNTDGDDALAREPMTGERDPRSEDRQLLLDAVLAATERLVITYTGANEISGQERPPAVPLGELLDALDATATAPARVSLRDHVLVRHPLQSYDARNLTPGALGSPTPFTFDRAALAGGRAAAGYAAKVAAGDPPGRALFLPQPLPARTSDEISLKDLQDFFAHPAKAFLKQRLDVAVPFDEDEPDDAMPLDLDSLEKWAIGDRVLRRLLEGEPIETIRRTERARGDLPPGLLAAHLVSDVLEKAQALATGSRRLLEAPSESHDVAVRLDGGRRLTGVVSGVRDDRIVRVSYSRLAPKHRLAAWVDLVALSAARPDRTWVASTVGWSSQGPRVADLSPVEVAADILGDLVDLYDRGMRAPLPLPVQTAAAYAGANRFGSGDSAAAREWETRNDGPVPGEQDDAAHLMIHQGRRSYRETREAPGQGEAWNDEPHRLGRLSLRVWKPLLAHENLHAL